MSEDIKQNYYIYAQSHPRFVGLISPLLHLTVILKMPVLYRGSESHKMEAKSRHHVCSVAIFQTIRTFLVQTRTNTSAVMTYVNGWQ